jgi:hypothetical protein
LQNGPPLFLKAGFQISLLVLFYGAWLCCKRGFQVNLVFSFQIYLGFGNKIWGNSFWDHLDSGFKEHLLECLYSYLAGTESSNGRQCWVCYVRLLIIVYLGYLSVLLMSNRQVDNMALCTLYIVYRKYTVCAQNRSYRLPATA